MNIPAAVFGLVCALLVGAVFHLLVDGGPGRLFLYLFMSVIGFTLGQWLGIAQGWYVFRLGELDLGLAVPCSVLAILLTHWLAKGQKPPSSSGGRV